MFPLHSRIGSDKMTLATPIQQFYAGQSVFITGGTGFLGKVLIEKLLRSCPEIASLYLLVRSKRGLNATQRMDIFFEDPIFQRLKIDVPKFREKVVAVTGDYALPSLGLSPLDRDSLIREITVVFNVAATLRFDEKIKEAVAVNIRGPREILNLCRNMANLRVIIHVSTAYSNCLRHNIEEKFYPSTISADSIIELVNILGDAELEKITPNLIGNYPNSYTFTKQIAEQVIQQYGKNLPIGVFRPAIVGATYKESVEGWADNVNGATGVLVGIGSGLMRTLHVDLNGIAELVPVDYTVNALIATAWDVATNKRKCVEPPIYHYHSSWNKTVTWGDYLTLCLKYQKQMPILNSHWCYTVTIATNSVMYYIYSMLLHTIPALLMDTGLLISGQKPRAIKTYKKVHKFSAVINYFDIRTWKFTNQNTRALWEILTPEDKKLFHFSMFDFDWDDYLYKCIAGMRLYWFKEDPSTIPVARKRMARILILHKAIKCGFFSLICWLMYNFLTLVFDWRSTSSFSTM